MADVLTAEQRRRNMSAIKGKDTKPEMIVRRLAHGLGYRFRLHRRDLPGKPDLVFPRLRKAILVHGCYWHMHDCRWGNVSPKTNAEFWQAKRRGNAERDTSQIGALHAIGWQVLIVWECQTRDLVATRELLRAFLNAGVKPAACRPASLRRRA